MSPDASHKKLSRVGGGGGGGGGGARFAVASDLPGRGLSACLVGGRGWSSERRSQERKNKVRVEIGVKRKCNEQLGGKLALGQGGLR